MDLLPGLTSGQVARGAPLHHRTRTNKKVSDSIKAAKDAIKWPANYVICNDISDLGRIAREISRTGKFAYDTETSGLNPWADKLYCVSIYVNGTSYLVNFEHPLLPKLTVQQFRDVLGDYFKDPSVKRIGFNLSFDDHFIEERAKIACGPQYFDGSTAIWLLHPEKDVEKGLKALAGRFLGDESSGNFAQQFGRHAWTHLDPTVAAYYAIKDADLTWRWYEHAEAELAKSPDLHFLMHELEMPVQNIYYETERFGFQVDIDYLEKDLGTRLELAVIEQEAEMNALLLSKGITDTVDWMSPQSIGKLLFNTLKLRKVDGESTNRNVLNELKDKHPIVPLILEYRALTKLKTAFVDALPSLVVYHDDGSVRLHPSFRVIGSETGRTSSQDPNILQMPTRAGNDIRHAFISCAKVLIPAEELEQPDYYLVSKDFSGQELRIQASLSQDDLLREIVATGGDIYSETAAVFYGGDAKDYTKHGPNKSKRDKGKMAVLALSYGASEFKLAQIFDCSVSRAKQFIKDFNARFPGLKKLTDDTIAFAKKHGYVRTVLGRRRPARYDTPGLTPGQIGYLDRLCANTPIQGSAADQIKVAILLCAKHLKSNGYKSRVLTGIHDEILFLVNADEWNNTPLSEELDYIMRHALEFPGVEMTTSTEVYRHRWGEADAD